MLRSILLYFSGAAWLRKLVMHLALAKRVARRFVAGETCEEAMAAIRALNTKGITATADHLGENVSTEAESRRAAADYIALMDCIRENGVTSTISLKLTQLGLDLSEELCLQNMRRILDYGRKLNMQVTIDMEGSAYTQRTVTLFHVLHDEEGYDNVQLVIQAYLYRSEADIKQLVDSRASVRLCKGAYQEPPEVAFPHKADTDANYVKLTELLLAGASHGNGGYPAIATHDEKMIEAAKQYANQNGIGRDAFEFQMLYGIRSEMQEALVHDGYRMRVYVPYGTEWYPYFMRRLAERPANLWFFVGNLFRN